MAWWAPTAASHLGRAPRTASSSQAVAGLGLGAAGALPLRLLPLAPRLEQRRQQQQQQQLKQRLPSLAPAAAAAGRPRRVAAAAAPPVDGGGAPAAGMPPPLMTIDAVGEPSMRVRGWVGLGGGGPRRTILSVFAFAVASVLL